MTWVNVPAAIAMVLMLCLYTRRSVEIAIPLAISLAMPALLVLAAVRALSYVDWLSAALLAGAGAWLVRGIRTGRVTRTAACTFLKEQVFTPGLACFALLGVFWTLANQDRAVLNYDEYSYWATQVRSLYVSDGLVGGARTCCMEHAAYPPGMQLLEWWFMHLLGLWHEGTLYAAAFWLNSAFLLPLARRITWRRWWQAGLFAVGVVALPTVLTGHAYSMLATDTTLGVIFGALMCILWTEGRAPHAPLTAGALMAALVLSKQTGILWAVLGMAFLLTTQGRQALRSRRWLTACAAPLVMLALWQAYCRMEGLGSMHLERMLSASPVWDEVLWAWEWIVKTLLIRPLNRSGGWDGMMPLAGLPAAVWAALFCGVILWRVKGPLRGRCVLFAAGTFALYALVVMGSAATVFAPEIPRWQAHPERLTEVVDRYFIPYFYAMACWMALLMEDAPAPRARAARGVIAVCACLGLALTVNWQNLACFLPGGFAARFPTDNGSAWLRENLSWYTRIETPDDARVLVAPGTVSSMRYALAPVSLVATGGLWEDGDTAEALLALADAVSATHLVATEPQSAQALAEALGQEVRTDTLYLIERARSAGMLVEVLP